MDVGFRDFGNKYLPKQVYKKHVGKEKHSTKAILLLHQNVLPIKYKIFS